MYLISCCVGVCHKEKSKMGRMYGKGKGLSRSALPYKRSAPSWLKVAPTEVCFIQKLKIRVSVSMLEYCRTFVSSD